jgi:hypothetical protein
MAFLTSDETKDMSNSGSNTVPETVSVLNIINGSVAKNLAF